MKAAVYSGTRNLYRQMLIAAKSLLIHSNVEKIYFLIEDDEFPYQLPKEIECRNISNQAYFHSDGPNFKNVCTYMVLIRAAYTKIFPDLDRILTIDVDTVVNENISELWELDLTDYYIAAVKEKDLSKQYNRPYINMGVAMLNLDKIRQDKKDEELIDNLNTYFYRYSEQDCFNEVLKDGILTLPSDYNSCIQAEIPQHEKITHYAGIYNLKNIPNLTYYDWPLDNLPRNIQDNITLDIIIPTYNNLKGLERTLRSITTTKNVNIIIVDDASSVDCSELAYQYNASLYKLQKNSGPGLARQYGLDHSSGTYISFLDTGDYFYENGVETILEQIQKNTYYKIYSYAYVYDDSNILADHGSDKTIGLVYKRSFIDMYNIRFSENGSYANEDYGFCRTAKLILKDLTKYKFAPMIKHIKIPVFYEHIDKKSLTKSNNSEFFYAKTIPGLTINNAHVIKNLQQWNVDYNIITEELYNLLARFYYIFLCIAKDRPELLDDQWEALRNFYYNNYYPYKKIDKPNGQYEALTIGLLRTDSGWKNKKVSINFNQFLTELEQSRFCPLKYYHLTSF